MPLTTVTKNATLDAMLGATPTLFGSNVDIGLSTTDPGDDGLSATEPSGGGYSRITIANNGTNWPAASNGIKKNGVAFEFAEATASWGTITHWVLYDSGIPQTSGIIDDGIGNPLPKIVAIGNQPRFITNELRVVLE